MGISVVPDKEEIIRLLIAKKEVEEGRYNRAERRRMTRRIKKEIERSSKEVRYKVRRDFETARYPDLAQRLLSAGAVRGGFGGRREIYLRIGAPPEGFMSTNSGAGYQEGGLCVFRGQKTAEGHYILQPPNVWVRRDVINFFGTQDRQEAYFVQGRPGLTGKLMGSDGEPVLTEVWHIKPVPEGAIIAQEPASRALELWNERRGISLEDYPPAA